jgi:hypothetical protein
MSQIGFQVLLGINLVYPHLCEGIVLLICVCTHTSLHRGFVISVSILPDIVEVKLIGIDFAQKLYAVIIRFYFI